MKRKIDHIGGHDPWEIEIAYWINHRGTDPDKARAFVIIRWMWHGDLRPLAAAIGEGHVLHQGVLNWLARMIDEDRLTIKRNRHGRPKPPDKFARDIVAALLYEDRTTDNSKDAFKEIADILSMSHQSVRQAVTRWRKTSDLRAK
jgi:hypothetical protein